MTLNMIELKSCDCAREVFLMEQIERGDADDTFPVRLQQLSERARLGDDEAIAELLKLLEPELVRHVRVQLRSKRLRYRDGVDRNAETGSVLNTVLVRFLRLIQESEASAGETIENPLAYLRAALTNEVLARVRQNARYENRDDLGALITVDDQELMKQWELYEDVKIAEKAILMSPFSDLERRVVEMIRKGCSCSEISEILGVSTSVVRARKSSALAKIREQLGKGDDR